MWAAITLTALVLVGASARTPNDGQNGYTEAGDCKVFKYLITVVYILSLLGIVCYPKFLILCSLRLSNEFNS